MAETEDFRYSIVPVQILGIDVEEISRGQGVTRRVEDIERLVDKLTQLAKAFVDRSDVGRLCARSLKRGTWQVLAGL